MLKEKRYGTIKIWRYNKKEETISKCSVYLTVNDGPKIRECERKLSPEVRQLIEETMVDNKGKILNTGATYDPGGGPEGGFEWEIEPDEEKILAALRDNRWDYRTIDGIAKETNIPIEIVKAFLESRKDVVWKSSLPDRLGRDLYTLNERRPQSKEFWRNISTFTTKTSS